MSKSMSSNALIPLIAREWNPAADRIPDEFFQLPVYDAWPNSHPEEAESVRQAFSPHNPYFQGGKAWLGLVPGQTRVAGFWNKDQEFNRQNVAYFGYWETKDQLEANQVLFDELRAWAKAQGASLLVGPVNFSTFANYRIRLDGNSNDEIMLGEPFNPPYYAKILERLGLASAMRYESVFMKVNEDFRGFLAKQTQDRKHPAYSEFQFKLLSQDTWIKRLPEFHELTMTFFKGAAGFNPISFEAFKAFYGPIIGTRHCPKTTLYVTNHEDRIIAYMLCFPNYGALIKRGPGKTPIAIKDLRFESAFPLLHEPELVLKTIGVHPEFRGRGLQHVLAAESTLLGLEAGYTRICHALMREGNPSNKVHSDRPADKRIYVLYAQALKEISN